MPDIDNPDLVAHETRITDQIEHARTAYRTLSKDDDGNAKEPCNEDVLSFLSFLAEVGLRLEPDPEGIMAAARDHLAADKIDYVKWLMDGLPLEVKKIIDLAKESGIGVALLAMAGDCNNPDCPVHHPK